MAARTGIYSIARHMLAPFGPIDPPATTRLGPRRGLTGFTSSQRLSRISQTKGKLSLFYDGRRSAALSARADEVIELTARVRLARFAGKVSPLTFEQS